MSEKFDPYHEWLGIPASEQPPHHYRLLAIPVFEESPTVIEHAADRQMAHLRTFQTGKHSAESQRLLNEVAAARVCLLHPAKRAAYDQQLRDTLQAQQPKTADQPGVPAAFEFLDQEKPSRKTAPVKQASKPRAGIYLAAAAGAAMVLIAVVWAAFFSGGGGSGAANLARQPATPEPVTPKVIEPVKPRPHLLRPSQGHRCPGRRSRRRSRRLRPPSPSLVGQSPRRCRPASRGRRTRIRL